MEQHIINQQISAAIGEPFEILQIKGISGGCINQAYKITGAKQSFFVKLNAKALLPMFAAEFAGLQEMLASKSISVPEPVVYGEAGEQAFIVLQWLDFAAGNQHTERLMGQQLAQMHAQPMPFFGWHQDNTIGSTAQPNTRHDNWLQFWQQQRLGFQLQLAEKQGYAGQLQRNGELLCAELGQFFTTYMPQPALIHGDLWSGNAAADKQGNPVVFDPACYYGDAEADLAMTELFGGFGSAFFAGYQEVKALDEGYSSRKILYNLYHILNHLNLFGAAYLSQAVSMQERLLAELKA